LWVGGWPELHLVDSELIGNQILSTQSFLLFSGNWSCGLCINAEELILKEPEVKQDLQFGERKRKVNVGLTEKEIKVR
jgi:hypothetical protein